MTVEILTLGKNSVHTYRISIMKVYKHEEKLHLACIMMTARGVRLKIDNRSSI